jgi:hypothetical protein
MALEPSGDLGHAESRVRLDEQVNVVGHHFQSVNHHLAFSCLLSEQNFEFPIDLPNEDRPTLLRTPHKVKLEAEQCASVLSVPAHALILHPLDT